MKITKYIGRIYDQQDVRGIIIKDADRKIFAVYEDGHEESIPERGGTVNQERVFSLKITNEDRETLLRAMNAMCEEYQRVIDELRNAYLANQFRDDLTKFNRVVDKLRRLATRIEMNAKVADYLREGNKIWAIKAVREITSWGLKEAKDYVDAFDGTEEYGADKF